MIARAVHVLTPNFLMFGSRARANRTKAVEAMTVGTKAETPAVAASWTQCSLLDSKLHLIR